ncbi:hypothetical protein JM18_009625 [Phytophthora kernoviae]|uniref:Uncharacterized protein n=2 Tax=Phytophthora kernoviae TaxID=325452 RepID=A0A921V2S8_9STRA|nr:hypothetical protein G195_011439 [Phytophthora kernoviae 00238/432]KAG2503070.1 hypothetical protein JM18_009625 [Phytophthora kernoviae]
MSLLERFYDSTASVVILDGVDLKELNMQRLCEHISLISQEPVLFTSTIAVNRARKARFYPRRKH